MLKIIVLSLNNALRHNVFKYQWAFAGIPILGCFLLNIVIMFIMIWSLIKLQRKMNRLRNNWRTSTTQSVQESSFNGSMINRFSRRISMMSSFTSQRSKNRDDDLSGGFRDTIRDRQSIYASTSPSRSITNRSSVIRQSEMERNLQLQAVLYALGFIISFFFTYANRILVSKHGSSPFIILLLPRIFRPLQGLFNIIIYTRIRVSRLRANTGYSWMKAFYTVVRSFDDHDDCTYEESSGEERRGRRRSIFQRLLNDNNENPNLPSFPILDPSEEIETIDKDEMNKKVEFENEEGSEKECNPCLSEKDSTNSYMNNIDETCNEDNINVQEAAPNNDGDAVSVSDQDGDSGSEKEIDGCQSSPLSYFPSDRTTIMIAEIDKLKGFEGKDDDDVDDDFVQKSFFIP